MSAPPSIIPHRRVKNKTEKSDGNSAIAVVGSNFVKGAKILFDGKPLATTYGGPEGITATVPDEYIATPRIIEVTVENPDGKVSHPAQFTVMAKP